MNTGNDGVWVRFAVSTIPPLSQIDTLGQRVRGFFLDALKDASGALSKPTPETPIVGGGTRAGVFSSVRQYDDVPPPRTESPAKTVQPPRSESDLASLGLGSVSIQEVPDSEFTRLGRLVDEFEVTIDLRAIPETRRHEIVEDIRMTLVLEAMRLRGEVVLRILNNPPPSFPGDPPAPKSGFLARNIRVVVPEDALGMAVGTDVDYGRFLEFGTQTLAARPYLFPVFEREKDRIHRAVERARRGASDLPRESLEAAFSLLPSDIRDQMISEIEQRDARHGKGR